MIDALRQDLSDEQEANEHQDDQFEKDAKMDYVKKNKQSKTEDEELSIITTAMIILLAGYDTTGTTMAHGAYELAVNPEVQEKLVKEIEAKVDECNGDDLDYTTLQNMPYLDQVIKFDASAIIRNCEDSQS